MLRAKHLLDTQFQSLSPAPSSSQLEKNNTYYHLSENNNKNPEKKHMKLDTLDGVQKIQRLITKLLGEHFLQTLEDSFQCQCHGGDHKPNEAV